jgi:hypothetical protein
MAFKMKYSGGTPFHFHGGDPAEHTSSTGEIDPKKLNYETTETVKNLAGKDIDTAGTATVIVPGKEVEKFAQPGTPEYDKWKAAVEKNPSIEDKYKDREVTVTRKRDYDQDVKLYPNPFKDMENYKGVFLEKNVRESDSLPSLTIARGFKTANDPEGYQAYLDKHGYKKKKRGTKTKRSESLGEYRYIINE